MFLKQTFIIDEYAQRFRATVTDRFQNKKDNRPFLIVSERSLLTNAYTFIDQAFENDQLTVLEHQLLKEKSFLLFSSLMKDFNLNPFFLLLDDSVTNVLTRIKLRDRKGEESLNETSIGNLSDRYRKLYLENTLQFPKDLIILGNFTDKWTKRIDHSAVIKKIFFLLNK